MRDGSTSVWGAAPAACGGTELVEVGFKLTQATADHLAQVGPGLAALAVGRGRIFRKLADVTDEGMHAGSTGKRTAVVHAAPPRARANPARPLQGMGTRRRTALPWPPWGGCCT